MFDLSCHPTYEHAELAIDFLVVGGGVAGLSSALALSRVGHRVVVLEQFSEAESSKTSHGGGGVRLPPNVVKILFRWGFEESLRAISFPSVSLQINKYETGEVLGTHVWEEEALSETGGEFLVCHRTDLRRLLLDAAIKAGAKIHTGVKVASVDCDDCHVTLSTGVTIRADVIVGADGCSSLIQQAISGSDMLEGVPSSCLFYNTTVPTERMQLYPELDDISSSINLLLWTGHNATLSIYRVGGKDEFAFNLWVNRAQPINNTDLYDEMRQYMGHCEPRLLKIAELARPPTRAQVRIITPLENWVHSNGRILIIGEAAHPLPAGSNQGSALAVEDAAVLAKLFSHLRTEDQIPTLLHAFQELREGRCASVVHSEQGNLAFLMMPHSQQQEQRDNMMRRRHAAGENVFSSGGAAAQWENIKELFGYDPEDQADDWWIKWGLLREHAKERFKDLTERMNSRFFCAPPDA